MSRAVGIFGRLIACFAALAMAAPSSPDSLPDAGLDLMTRVKVGFYIDQVPGYADALESGKPTGPVFNWGLGVLLSALNAAARVDPEWKSELKRVVEASRAYWNPKGAVPGFDVLPGPKPVDRYYDDNAWMVLALVDAAKILDDPAVLKLAEEALTYVLSGEDEHLGGGIYWRETERKSKNACSNGPAAAACLAVFAETKDPKLLDKAITLYEWTKTHLQDPNDHLLWDSMSLQGKVDKTKWSYNTALMIRTAAELARITGEARFRDEAEQMAASSERQWLRNGRLADEGRFAHLLLEAWAFAPNESRSAKRRAALEWLVNKGRHASGWYGNRFDREPATDRANFELIDQVSAARAFLTASD